VDRAAITVRSFSTACAAKQNMRPFQTFSIVGGLDVSCIQYGYPATGNVGTLVSGEVFDMVGRNSQRCEYVTWTKWGFYGMGLFALKVV
jgi:hypothetical protein